MMKNENIPRISTRLAALLMFAIFAVTILCVLFAGAKAYGRLTSRSSSSYNSRTAMQYIATKVRQAPNGTSVSVGTFSGKNTLIIRQELDGTPCVTRIYCHNGWLMELFTLTENSFSPEDGEKILPLEGLSLSQDGSLLTVSIPGSASLRLHLQGHEEVLP